MVNALDFLSNTAAGVGRGIQALGSLGLSELDRIEDRKRREQQQRIAEAEAVRNAMRQRGVADFISAGNSGDRANAAARLVGSGVSVGDLAKLQEQRRIGANQEFLRGVLSGAVPSGSGVSAGGISNVAPLLTDNTTAPFAREIIAQQRRREDIEREDRIRQEDIARQERLLAEKRAREDAIRQEKINEERKVQQDTAKARLQSAATSTEIVNDAVDDAKDKAGVLTTGFVGSLVSAVPGTAAFDLARTLDTIKANIGFDKLAEMRANSPTGGALGQVSERENILLQSTIANLEQSQSQEQFVKNLDRVKTQYGASIENLKNAYIEDFGSLDGFPFEVEQSKEAQPNSVQGQIDIINSINDPAELERIIREGRL